MLTSVFMHTKKTLGVVVNGFMLLLLWQKMYNIILHAQFSRKVSHDCDIHGCPLVAVRKSYRCSRVLALPIQAACPDRRYSRLAC